MIDNMDISGWCGPDRNVKQKQNIMKKESREPYLTPD